MEAKIAMHSFQGGMTKDLDVPYITNNSYYDALNVRPITSKGLSTGSLENIEGNKLMVDSLPVGYTIFEDHLYCVNGAIPVTYNGVEYETGECFRGVSGVNTFTGDAGATVIDVTFVVEYQFVIVGFAELRDKLIFFQSNGADGKIVLAEYSNLTETITSYKILYDDRDNNNSGKLNLPVDKVLKTVVKYETPEIQKVYWTDGINNVRFINAASNNTNDGDPKNAGNHYLELDLLEFVPGRQMDKPYLDKIISGNLKPGTVQYSYQYFKLHGAESVFSPVSNTYHVVSSPDDMSHSLEYKGDKDRDVPTNKGFEITIPLESSDKYDRVRIVRLYYSTLHALPEITIVGEVSINSDMTSVNFKDTGLNVIGVLTLDEFNIMSTNLFAAEDIAVKNNLLFAANITERDYFEVKDWDARAVRFKKNIINQTSYYAYSTAPLSFSHEDMFAGGIEFVYYSDYAVTFRVDNALSYLASVVPPGTNLSDITSFSIDPSTSGSVIEINYTQGGGGSQLAIETVPANVSIVGTYDSNSDSIEFLVTCTNLLFSNFASIENGSINGILFQYEYIIYDYESVADVESSTTTGVTIAEPTDPDDIDDWLNSGWSDYDNEHDGINVYNDPDNDYSSGYAYKYQSDGETLGAEGPNIKIDFGIETIVIDEEEKTNNLATSTTPENVPENRSYKGYASPFNSGKRSWQRDETYRLFVVFFDERGLASFPKWICDLRMPSLAESAAAGRLAFKEDSVIKSNVLFPRVYFRSFPEGAVSAQILRVRREMQDRSVLTQALALPISAPPGATIEATNAYTNSTSRLLKLISPEINITKNVNFISDDYIEYVSRYDFASENFYGAQDVYNFKCKDTLPVSNVVGNRVKVNDAVYLTPNNADVRVGGALVKNYDSTLHAFGSSGLGIRTDSPTWNGYFKRFVLVNYRRKIFDSQYGGNTYNKRIGNIGIPASDVIKNTEVYTPCYNGDTFINYMYVATKLFDLTRGNGNSRHEYVLFPVESSINCAIQHGYDVSKYINKDIQYSALAQEVAGRWENTSGKVFEQEEAMYQYNTVYSQDSTAKYYMNADTRDLTVSEFDCKIKVSKHKFNGETTDSWAKFPVNNFIEVDSVFGPVTALSNVNDKLLYWQENAIGILSVNERSVISDGAQAQLVIGTGGVLDRYDYISTTVGTGDKRSIVISKGGVYWFYDKERSLYRLAEGMENITKNKAIQSWFTKYGDTDLVDVFGVYDIKYNEVIYTLRTKYGNVEGKTIVFNESTDAFTSFYSFVPKMYFPLSIGYLSSEKFVSNLNNVIVDTDVVFYHNSNIEDRGRFNYISPYSIDDGGDLTTEPDYGYKESNLSIVTNEEYPNIKVFDSFVFDTTVTSYSRENFIGEFNNESFHRLRCINNYQDSGLIDLEYKENLERRERLWTTVVPRNAMTTFSSDSPHGNSLEELGETSTNIDQSRTFKERMRDRYMLTRLFFDNNGNKRLVISSIGTRFRLSPR